jgi:Acyl-CoA reductase (LuxC)
MDTEVVARPLSGSALTNTGGGALPIKVPLVIRGRVVEEFDVEFGGRRGGIRFRTPDVRKYLRELGLRSPAAMADLHTLSFEDIVEYFAQLGPRLRLDRNLHLQASFQLSALVSGLGPEMIRHQYDTFQRLCAPEKLREMAELAIGIRYLEGWVPQPMANGCIANIRAFGARAVHIMAGNVPAVSMMSIVRNAITRSDAILKTPSNDPLTATAIARTMIDMAPEHPLTRHLSVAYWKGGDVDVEGSLYLPTNIEKIIAWGGLASITHIARYIQPGIDLITLDPKLSSSIVGREAFADEATMREVAARLAEDVAYYNQEACVNSRVAYIQTGTDAAGIALANRFGQMVYEAIQQMPITASCPAKALHSELAQEIQALRMMDDHTVIGAGREGGVIVSTGGEPVDFAPLLQNRIANLVPFDSIDVPVRSVNAYTQTIGVFPEELKRAIRDRCVFHGAQRLVTLGYAGRAAQAGPHDGIEPLRRMCKWITDEVYDPAKTPRPSCQ